MGAEKHASAVLQLMGEPLWDVRRAAPRSVGSVPSDGALGLNASDQAGQESRGLRGGRGRGLGSGRSEGWRDLMDAGR